MIFSRSRYATNPVTLLETERGSALTILPNPSSQQTINYTYVSVGVGERLDQMAFAVYGDETAWWKIADANPEILDWTDIPVGTILRVPSAG